jgi:hypothetical protein
MPESQALPVVTEQSFYQSTSINVTTPRMLYGSVEYLIVPHCGDWRTPSLTTTITAGIGRETFSYRDHAYCGRTVELLCRANSIGHFSFFLDPHEFRFAETISFRSNSAKQRGLGPREVLPTSNAHGLTSKITTFNPNHALCTSSQ